MAVDWKDRLCSLEPTRPLATAALPCWVFAGVTNPNMCSNRARNSRQVSAAFPERSGFKPSSEGSGSGLDCDRPFDVSAFGWAQPDERQSSRPPDAGPCRRRAHRSGGDVSKCPGSRERSRAPWNCRRLGRHSSHGRLPPNHDEPLSADHGRNVVRVFQRSFIDPDQSADLVASPSFTVLWVDEVGIFRFSSEAFSSSLR